MSELHSQVCFDALSILNNVQVVETVCNLCGASHFTGNCPILRQGTYVADTPQQTFSRSSIPKGLIIMNSETEGTCVITSQKFAKGTRFGPLLAPATFFPTKETKFPLIIFPTHQYNNEETYDIQDLFTGRNIYLDTTDDSFCNWMVHVSPAKYSNEQNLCCYQENYEIYYAAIQDLELGDILKVWYSSTYASIMGAKLLEPSPFDICNNILRQVSKDYGFNIDENQALNTNNSFLVCDETLADIKNDTEIALPPVMSLLKTTVHNFSNIKDDSLNIYDYNRSFSVNNEKNNRLMNNDTLVNHADMHVKLNVSRMIEETIKYGCDICSRKYATKLTLEKHLRTHGLFLCIVCDKLYDALSEMENHECYKKKNRSRPLHCQVCLKLLSNSWSLNRHMKIHRNTDTEPTNLYKSPGDKTFHQCISLKETRESSCEENNENLKCSVCNRQYKNINGLEKHLRTTHTVHTKEMSFIQKARNKPILSKNSTPIKPSVAKALVSKLTKRKEANSDTQHKSEIYEKTTFDNYSKPSIDIVQNIKLKGHAPVDKKTVIEKYESETNNSPILDGENSEEHHTECRKIVFYRCPYCEKPPLKARSSLKKHFSRAHGNYINEWKASNFLSKQILRDDKVIRRLRNKYNEKKRLQVTSGKLNLKIKKKKCILPIRKTTNEPYSDLNIDKTEANIRNTFSTSTKVPKTKKNNDKTFDIMCINSSNIGINSSIISNENVLSKINEHENIDNLFFENLNIFLDPLNENTYTEDVTIQSINYIQENFQNSFDKIQEKLDAELQLSQERDLIWKNSCNFGGLSEEVISKNAYDLDESVMLNLN